MNRSVTGAIFPFIRLVGLVGITGLMGGITISDAKPERIFKQILEPSPEIGTMNNSTLTPKEQNIAAICAHAARGNKAGLQHALSNGLDSGLTVNELKEVLVQLYAYCGFPRSLNALTELMHVTKERANRGIKDVEGKLPSSQPQGKSLDYGTANQTKLCGSPVSGQLFEFAPAIDEYLKAHLFGDIFSRDTIDWKTRELATIAALSAMEGTEDQLAAHKRIGAYNGLSDAQIDSILHIAGNAAQRDAFPQGDPTPANFTGKAWVSMLINNKEYDMSAYNVTFAPGTRNNWHSHARGQILFCTTGIGYYQERGKTARRLAPGDAVEIPANTEHWHGASPHTTFTHLGITPNMKENATTWVSPVTDQEYGTATVNEG